MVEANNIRASDHPEVLQIAVQILLRPDSRKNYSPVVLSLADRALDRLRRALLDTDPKIE